MMLECNSGILLKVQYHRSKILISFVMKQKKLKKTRIEQEQEAEPYIDGNLEVDHIPQVIHIASVSDLGNCEVAANIDIEIIDEMQQFAVTPKNLIKWKYGDFDSSPGYFEPYDYNDENENDAYDFPGHYFSKYFTNELFETMVQCTNMYALQNNQTNFKLTNVIEFKKLLGLHIFFGSTGFPQLKMYWDNFIGIKMVSDVMTKNRFHNLRTNLHFVDNLAVSAEAKKDKYFKL